MRQFVTARPGVPKHIYCTYTSMLRVRAELAKLTTVADARRRAMNGATTDSMSGKGERIWEK